MKNDSVYITKTDYERIQEYGLNFIEIAKEHLSLEEIEALGFQKVIYKDIADGISFANYSSFIFEKESKEKSKKGIENEYDKDILENWEKLKDKKIRNDYVLLGINAGAAADGVNYEKFEMFQHSTRGGNAVSKYGRFLNDGLYITDYIKGMPTSNAGELSKGITKALNKLNKNDSNKSRIKRKDLFKRFSIVFGKILINELKIICNTKFDADGKLTFPTIIVLQKNPDTSIVNRMLTESELFDMDKVKNIPHYMYSSYDEVQTAFKNAIDRNDNILKK